MFCFVLFLFLFLFLIFVLLFVRDFVGGGGGVGFLRGCFFNVLLLFCYFCWVFKVIKKNIIKKNNKKTVATIFACSLGSRYSFVRSHLLLQLSNDDTRKQLIAVSRLLHFTLRQENVLTLDHFLKGACATFSVSIALTLIAKPRNSAENVGKLGQFASSLCPTAK